MSLPAHLGFAVTVGRRHRGSMPAAPLQGTRTPVTLASGALEATGWAASTAGGHGSGAGTAQFGGRALLLAGELYHRGRWEQCGISGLAGATDAEALLDLWARYGTAAFRMVEGRFAALVLDRDCLVVATDHAGSIPVHLTYGSDTVHVATTARALSAVHGEPTVVPALPLTSPVAGLRGVRRLHAGTVATLLGSRPEPSCARTWSPPQHRELHRPADAVAAVREALAAAVATRVAPGPTVVLSGGIDSSGVAALASATTRGVETVSMGTEVSDEFQAARDVADHLGTRHQELTVQTGDLLDSLPWAVAAAEITAPDILEYLLPLVVLYGRLTGGPRRILTGYGADIPLGGMHREADRLDRLDAVIADDMGTFDGLNEMTPLLTGATGHWTTHPYWDRSLLDLLVRLDPGVKRRDGIDKWVLRRACADLLPESTVRRPKLGVHEGSGTTSSWTARLHEGGVAVERVPLAKRAMTEEVYRAVVVEGARPEEVDMTTVWERATELVGVTA